MSGVNIALRPSRLFLGIQALMLFLSLAIVEALFIPVWVKAILTVGLVAYVVHLCRLHAAIHQLVTDGLQWEIQTRRGSVRGALRGDSTISAWIMIIRLSIPPKGRIVSFVLLPDVIPADAWRRLRVLACHGG